MTPRLHQIALQAHRAAYPTDPTGFRRLILAALLMGALAALAHLGAEPGQ